MKIVSCSTEYDQVEVSISTHSNLQGVVSLYPQIPDIPQMTAMEGKWTSTSFMALEMKLLYDLIKLIKNGHPYDWLASIRNCIIRLTIISFVSLGVLGRFSTKDDSEEYEIPKNNIFWFYR